MPTHRMPTKVAIAIGAHPDDIEFYMAGTLLMLKRAGFETHYLNLASGNCGSAEYNGPTTRSIRNTEARDAAKVLGARRVLAVAEDAAVWLEVAHHVVALHPRRRAVRVGEERDPALGEDLGLPEPRDDVRVVALG